MADIVERLREPNGMADSALPPNERAEAADEIARLRAALETMSDRIDQASKMFNDSTVWHVEDAPNGEGSLYDWVHEPSQYREWKDGA